MVNKIDCQRCAAKLVFTVDEETLESCSECRVCSAVFTDRKCNTTLGACFVRPSSYHNVAEKLG